MTRLLLLVTVAGALAACGDPSSDPGDDARTTDARPPDARVPDAGVADAAPDAVPDARTDADGDGIDDGDDCAADDIARWRLIPTFVDNDRDGHGIGTAVDTCVGAAIPDTRAERGGDCDDADIRAFQLLPYAFRDGDGDGRFVAEAGSLCTGAALPTGYRTTDPGTIADCAPADPLTWDPRPLFPDDDGDGRGVAPASVLCIGAAAPAGWVAVDGDCAASDAGRWQLLAYSHRDRDGDGVTVAESGSVCSGAALPAGHATTGTGDDCAPDDITRWRAVDLHADGDHDGIGAGAAVATCIGTSIPAGQSTAGTDCAPNDITRWGMRSYSHIDGDGDGVTIPASGQVCTGAAVLPPYYLAPIGHDCDDDDDGLTRWLVLYPDGDGDGVGTTPYQRVCVGDTIPDGQSTRGYDIDDRDPAVIEDEDDDDELLDLILL